MSFGWREALTAVALLFVVFLVVKMRPSRRVRGALAVEVRAARDRARKATDPHARAEALCEAGTLAARQGRWTAATGFFLRAMRAEPAAAASVKATVDALHGHRPRLLAKVLWRHLARIPWDGAHADASRVTAEGLAALYRGGVRDGSKAAVMRRLAKVVEKAPEGG